ncbi:hypothetical protein AUP71_11245 [Corynebacterium glutamicum]|uniref:hypothetical protein n=1 Tax=Corynebacterium glutamicum TaxID=1718 RepID=UPI0009435846|nr:hypothetical protein [Corynebacterium glutamicum]OKX93034.1 hypothetical protein AUP71_11245 [Corynebacterium glutamicum]
MTNKLSPIPVIKSHLDTLRDAQTNKVMISDYATSYGIPIIFGGYSWWREFQVKDVGSFLGGIAVFAALLFALVVFVFQLRITAGNDPRTSDKDRLLKLLDQLFANVSYAVLIGLATTFLGIVSIWLTDEETGAPVWLSVFLVIAVTHLVLIIMMCLKRINSAYRRLSK